MTVKDAECEVCSLLTERRDDDSQVLLQTERWAAALDPNQIYLGKSFVTLRSHKQTIADLDAIDWTELHGVMRQLESAIKTAFGASVINWECLMNNAVLAGQPTHVHWHLYPRYLGGATFAGEEFPDPKWPRHLEGGARKVNDRLLGEITDAIYRQLSNS